MRITLRYTVLLGALSISSVAAVQATAQDGPFGLFSLKPSAPPRATSDEKTQPVAAPEPRRIATRLATFGIPIVAPVGREGVKEIQLHVSADLGKTWHLYYRVKPSDKYFPFKAAADGEYWFATRIVDGATKATPEGDLRPEMKVLIDTTPPKLALTSQIAENGEIRATWQATDPLLSPQSLKLEYQTSPNGPWRSIAVPASTPTGKNGALGGSVAWRPRDAGGMINLRAEVLDQAGNHAVALDRLEQGAIARGPKPLEPPIAGPAAAPPDEPKSEGAFASVSKWLGGALSSESKSKSPPADPYASAAPSDELGSSEPSSSHQAAKSSSSNWSTSDMELTDKGIRRLPVNRDTASKTSPANVAQESPRVIAEKRGPGRLASASTVKEPKREANDDEALRDKTSGNTRPAIQPPENALRDTSSQEPEATPDSTTPSEPEEIPPPREEMRRLNPSKQAEETPEPEAEPSQDTAPVVRRRAVESLPNEESRTPIPSFTKKKPEEFRTRSPIASGLKGDERGPARPPVTPQYRNASTARDTIETTTASNRLPTGVEPIYSKHLRFGLEYDVNTVGAGGVSEVELWATRDGGQSWSRWGSDPDRRSPFEVEVDGEGVFGFRIVVMSRGGLSSRPPQPGDEADSWVVVDSTAPKVTLRGAGYGTDERVGQLEIAWEAQDANLTEKSVSLFYSDREEGPWTRIVGDLANQGEYFWRVDSRIPPKIFIKVEIRDGAGNLAHDQTREAIRVEGLVPSGKIRRIIPRDEDKE